MLTSVQLNAMPRGIGQQAALSTALRHSQQWMGRLMATGPGSSQCIRPFCSLEAGPAGGPCCIKLVEAPFLSKVRLKVPQMRGTSGPFSASSRLRIVSNTSITCRAGGWREQGEMGRGCT